MLVLLVAGVSLAAWIWILVNAFRTSLMWGLGALLFSPLGVVFVILHWSENRAPALISLSAGLFAFILLPHRIGIH